MKMCNSSPPPLTPPTRGEGKTFPPPRLRRELSRTMGEARGGGGTVARKEVNFMEITAAKRLQSIGAYAFAEVDKEVEKLKSMGIAPIDFGVGDPTVPTPGIVRKATQKGITLRKSSGYPSYIGAPEFRPAVAQWGE